VIRDQSYREAKAIVRAVDRARAAERVDEARLLYLSGKSLRAVEAATGVGRETLRPILRAAGEARGRLDHQGSDRERLLANIHEDDSGCWLWTGQINNMGYGMACYGRRRMAAHRAIYMLFGNELAAGMDLCHRCDNPPCVNPAHMFVGTRADNMQDARRKGRLRTGEASPSAKLTEATVREIRRRHAAGIVQRRIADDLGVTFQTVNSVALRRTWRSVA